MKKQFLFFYILTIGLLLSAFNGQAQKKQISKEQFLVNVKPKIVFKPFVVSDSSVKKVDVNQLIKLPNGKQVTIKDYLSESNRIEKNLNEIGYSIRTMDKETQIAEQKLDPAIVISPKYSDLGNKLTIPQRIEVFKDETLIPNINLKTVSISNIQPAQIQAQKKSDKGKFIGTFKFPRFMAYNLFKKTVPKTEIFSREQTYGPWEKTLPAVGGVKLSTSYYLKGKAEYFDGDSPNLLAALKNTNSEFSMGLDIRAQMKIPMIDLASSVVSYLAGGYLDIYTFDADFNSRSNSSKKIDGKVKVKFINRLLIDMNEETTGNSLTFRKSETFPLNQLIGGMDVYQYGLNAVLPIDVYYGGEIGGSIDIKVDRAGIWGTMGPRISQSLTMEAGLMPSFSSSIADIGVGGKLDFVACDIAFGGNAGVSWAGGSIVLNNKAYLDLNLELLKGRIYTYYSYPVFTCDYFWEGLNPNCWATKTVRHNIVKTNALLQKDIVLLNDDDSKALDW